MKKNTLKEKKEVKPPRIFPGFQCRKCEQVRVSFFTHDFSQCACGNYVDGGGEHYFRYGGKFEDMIHLNITYAEPFEWGGPDKK